jgi:prolyl-tRNA editing enzyme YbaK/EbsC (Cys-tRNA(Pro) deacylase)
MSQQLNWLHITESSHLVSPGVLRKYTELPRDIFVAEIDPAFMNGMDFCNTYGVAPSAGANCIVVEAVRGDAKSKVAVVVLVGYRADLNGVVRKHLGAKKVSFANLDEVMKETDMEYGSITPYGLPDNYSILIDSRIMEQESLVVGSGRQRAKIKIPTSIFKELPHFEIVEGLANPVEG